MAPTAPARLAWIEAFRGVAASAVVLYHVARHFDANYDMASLKALFQFGHAGVDLFFVISGFVILFVHAGDSGRPERVRHYVERRLTRVLPIYWIAVALMIAKRWAGGHGTPLGDIARAALPVPIFADPLLGVAWTLQYESVFYVAFAVLILNRTAGVTVMAAWLAFIAVAAVWIDASALPEAFWQSYNLEFFAGMAVAYRLRNGNPRRYKAALAAGIVLFAAAAIAEDLGWMDGYGIFARFAYGLPSALIVMGGAESSRRDWPPVPFILRMLGAASYSIYLFHFIFIGILWQVWQATGLDRAIPPAISFGLFSSGAVVAGILISRQVEYPLMRLIRGFSARFLLRKSTGADVLG